MKRKYIIIIVIVVLLLLVILKLVGNKQQINKKSHPEPLTAVKIPVKLAVVTEQQSALNIVKTGNLAAFKEAKVLITTGGLVQQLRFQLGDPVHTGQVLAIIDTRSNSIDLQKAVSNTARLKSDLQTYSELYAGKAATHEKLEQVRQDYTDALNAEAQIRRQIDDASIKAPTDGIISVKSLEQGVFASAGAELATIVNLSKAKVQVNLTEMEVYQVQAGQVVKITTDVYPDKVFEGKVSFISPQADVTHNYPVEIMVENSGKSVLRSGTFVYADFSRKIQGTTLVIPREALIANDKDATVYVLGDSNRVVLRSVATGSEMNGMIAIRSGLQKGERVVVSGQINLKNGTEVSISK